MVLDALLHLVDRLLFVERHEERVLALADLVAQAITDRFEVVLRHEQPLVLLVERAQIADVVGRQVDHRGGQRPQLLGQRLGVAQVRRVVGRADADEQQRHVPHPLLRAGQRHHARIVAGEQLGERRLQLEPRGEEGRGCGDRQRSHQDQGRVSGEPAVVTADTAVRGGRHRRRTLPGFHRRASSEQQQNSAKQPSIGQLQSRCTRFYMYVREVSPGTCCLRMASPPISLSMASLRLAVRGTLAIALIAIGIAISARPAFAVGEEITDVRVLDNQRTEEATVRSIAGLSIGDTLEADTLDIVRERLNTTGLFADVNVWWEPHGSGVRVNISVKDKFPWAPVPTASWSSNNKSIGLLFVHGNLFGRGKQLLLGARAGADRFGRRARLPRSLAVRHLDLLAAAGGGAAPGHPRVPELGRDAARCRLARQPVRVPRDAALLVRVRALLRRRLDAPGEDPGGLAPRAVLLLQRRDRSGRSDAADRLGPPLQHQRPARPRDQGGHLGLSAAPT